MPEKCFSRNTIKQIYYIGDLFTNFEFMDIFAILALFYNLYYDFDFECRIENTLYDLS